MQESATSRSGSGLHGAGHCLLSSAQTDQTNIAGLPTSPGRLCSGGVACFCGQTTSSGGGTHGTGDSGGAQVFKIRPASQPRVEEVLQSVTILIKLGIKSFAEDKLTGGGRGGHIQIPDRRQDPHQHQKGKGEPDAPWGSQPTDHGSARGRWRARAET